MANIFIDFESTKLLVMEVFLNDKILASFFNDGRPNNLTVTLTPDSELKIRYRKTKEIHNG